MLYTGKPGGHQTCQQEEDRADQTSFTGAKTRKCSLIYPIADMGGVFFFTLAVSSS